MKMTGYPYPCPVKGLISFPLVQGGGGGYWSGPIKNTSPKAFYFSFQNTNKFWVRFHQVILRLGLFIILSFMVYFCSYSSNNMINIHIYGKR